MATIKEKLPMSGIRHVVVTCRRATNVVRNLKFLTLPDPQSSSLSTNVTVPTRVVVTGELPCVTNTHGAELIYSVGLTILRCLVKYRAG